MQDTTKKQKHHKKPQVGLELIPCIGTYPITKGVSFISFPCLIFIETIQRGGESKTQSPNQRGLSTPCKVSNKERRGEILKTVVKIQVCSKSVLTVS
jgi:hypothetical protein